MVIRRWNPAQHPRDRRGRFISVGMRIRSGGRGGIVVDYDEPRGGSSIITVKLDNGNTRKIASDRIEVEMPPAGMARDRNGVLVRTRSGVVVTGDDGEREGIITGVNANTVLVRYPGGESEEVETEDITSSSGRDALVRADEDDDDEALVPAASPPNKFLTSRNGQTVEVGQFVRLPAGQQGTVTEISGPGTDGRVLASVMRADGAGVYLRDPRVLRVMPRPADAPPLPAPAPPPATPTAGVADRAPGQGPALATMYDDYRADKAKVMAQMEDMYNRDTGMGSQRATIKLTTFQAMSSGEVYIQGNVMSASGRPIGSITRSIKKVRGKYVLENDFLSINSSEQGNGIARDLYKRQEEWAKAEGIDRVEVHANIDVGGYAWAGKGFDFKTAAAAREYSDMLLRRMQINVQLPPEERAAAVAELKALMERSAPPTPYELSQIGRTPTSGDMWPGKAAMMGTHWYGVRRLQRGRNPDTSGGTPPAGETDTERFGAAAALTPGTAIERVDDNGNVISRGAVVNADETAVVYQEESGQVRIADISDVRAASTDSAPGLMDRDGNAVDVGDRVVTREHGEVTVTSLSPDQGMIHYEADGREVAVPTRRTTRVAAPDAAPAADAPEVPAAPTSAPVARGDRIAVNGRTGIVDRLRTTDGIVFYRDEDGRMRTARAERVTRVSGEGETTTPQPAPTAPATDGLNSAGAWRSDSLGGYTTETDQGIYQIIRAPGNRWNVIGPDGDSASATTLEEARDWAQSDVTNRRSPRSGPRRRSGGARADASTPPAAAPAPVENNGTTPDELDAIAAQIYNDRTRTGGTIPRTVRRERVDPQRVDFISSSYRSTAPDAKRVTVGDVELGTVQRGQIVSQERDGRGLGIGSRVEARGWFAITPEGRVLRGSSLIPGTEAEAISLLAKNRAERDRNAAPAPAGDDEAARPVVPITELPATNRSSFAGEITDAAVTEDLAAQASRISAADLQPVFHYVEGGLFTPVNRKLRNDDSYVDEDDLAQTAMSDDEIDAYVEKLDATLAQSRASAPGVVYRAENADLLRAQVGDTITDAGYMSTSFNPDFPLDEWDGTSVLKLTFPAGQTGIAVDGVGGLSDLEQSEFILPRGTSYTITAVERLGRRRVITGAIVPAASATSLPATAPRAETEAPSAPEAPAGPVAGDGQPLEVGQRITVNGRSGTVTSVRPGTGIIIYTDDDGRRGRSAAFGRVQHEGA